MSIVTDFNEYRERMNEVILGNGNLVMKRLWNLDTNTYPMPMYAHNKDEVFVGRIRRDESQPNSLNMWIVADNLRKGAATNTIQIAEYLIANKLV